MAYEDVNGRRRAEEQQWSIKRRWRNPKLGSIFVSLDSFLNPVERPLRRERLAVCDSVLTLI